MVISRTDAQRRFGYVSIGSAEIAICSPAWRLLDLTLGPPGSSAPAFMPDVYRQELNWIIDFPLQSWTCASKLIFRIDLWI
jgi:hypothetical protein